MPKPPFEEVWTRIIAYQGRTFRTLTNYEFSYMIKGNGFFPSKTRYRIDIIDFKLAYKRVPIESPEILVKKVRGPSYVWAVLHDGRISLGKW